MCISFPRAFFLSLWSAEHFSLSLLLQRLSLSCMPTEAVAQGEFSWSAGLSPCPAPVS